MSLDGTRLAFRLATYDRDRARELVERLVGQRTSSHGGTYVVRRKGRLDEIPHLRRIRGAVIVRTEHAGKVLTRLESFDAEVNTRKAGLTREDRRTLAI